MGILLSRDLITAEKDTVSDIPQDPLFTLPSSRAFDQIKRIVVVVVFKPCRRNVFRNLRVEVLRLFSEVSLNCLSDAMRSGMVMVPEP